MSEITGAWLAATVCRCILLSGPRTPCVTLFTCTSPWEIYDYGVQEKIVSPLLEEFFYKRGYDERATTAITVDEVFDAVMAQLETGAPQASYSEMTPHAQTIRGQTSEVRDRHRVRRA